MQIPVLVPLLLHALGPAGTSGVPAWSPPPFTLRPAPPVPGDTLACVIEAPGHDLPDRTSPLLREAAAGEAVVVTGKAVVRGVPWVATRAGWMEAARVDRPPPPTEGDLPVGREGMADGRVIPAGWRPSDLGAVPDSLKAPDVAWRRMELRAGALEAFRAMIDAAARDGVGIGIYSAWRSVEYQRPVYARYVEEDPLQRLSAAPGRSEHHLGTTADVATPGVTALRTEIAATPAGRWLAANAERFGIVATFSRERHAARGASWEPWHLRWVGDNTDDEEAW